MTERADSEAGSPGTDPPPTRALTDDEFRSRIVRQILIALTAATAIATILLFVSGDTGRGLTAAGLLAVLAIASPLVGRIGASATAAGALVATVLILTVGAATQGGVRDPGLAVFPVVIVIAGVAIGRRGVALVGLTVAASAAFLYLLEATDRIEPTPASAGVDTIVRLAVTASIVGVLLGYLQATERRRAALVETQRELLTTTDFYERLLETAPVGVTVTEVHSGGRPYASPTYTRLTGLTADELADMSETDRMGLIHPDDREEAAATWERFIASDGVDGAETTYRYRTAQGWRWFAIRSAVLDRDGDGAINRVVTSGIDITARVEADAQRHALLDAAPVMVTISDFDSGDRTYVSPEFTRYTGYDLESFNAMNEDERRGLIHPDDRDEVIGALDRFMASDGVDGRDVAYRINTIYGWRWVATSSRVLSRRADGSIDQMMVTGFDISRERQADDFRSAALSNSVAMVSIFDLTTRRMEYLNDVFTRISGWELADFAEIDRMELGAVYGPDGSKVIDAARRAIETGEPQEVRHGLNCADGSVRVLISRLAIIPGGPDGDDPKLFQSAFDITRLVEADAYRRAVLESSPAGITVHRIQDGGVDYVSPTFTELTGYTLDDFIALGGNPIEHAVPPDEREAMQAAGLAAAGDAAVGDIRHRIVHADGSTAWYDTRFVPFRDGTRTRLLATSMPISAQMEAESFSRTVLEANPNIVLVWDPDSMTAEYTNPAFVRTTGYDADGLNTLDRTTVPSLVHPDDLEPERKAIAEAIETGRAVPLLHRIRTAEGVWRWFETYYQSFPDLHGERPGRILVNSTDVTDRVESEEFQRAVLDITPAMTVVFDIDTSTTLYANAAYTTETGHTPDSVNALPTEDLLALTPGPDRDRVDEAIANALVSGEMTSARRRYHRADGEVRWYDTRFKRFPDPTGRYEHRIVSTAVDVTDQMETEQLNESILDASPITFLVYDHEPRLYEWANAAFTDATGFTVDQLNARRDDPGPVITHPDDLHVETVAIEQAIATGAATECRHRFVCADGSVRTFDSRFVHLPGDAENPSQRVLVASVDITDTVEAERFRDTVLETSPALTLVFDPVSNEALYANQAFRDLSGKPDHWPSDDAGRDPVLGESIPPEDRRRAGEAVAAALAGGTAQPLQHRFIAADGSTRHLQSFFSPFPDPSGRYEARMVVTAIDITDRIEAQALSDTILESSPAATVVVDPATGRTTYTNPAFTTATGHTAESLNSMPFEEMLQLTPDDQRAVVDAAIQATLETGEITSAERSYRSRNGDVRWYDSRFLRLPASTGDEVIVTAIDTTERRAAQLALEEERAQLERANKALEDFVYIASHDLQEPLRTISAFSELLRTELPDDLSDDAETALRFVGEGAGRMRDLVSGLLEHSRIGRNRQISEVDTGRLVDEILTDLGDLISREGPEISVEALPTLAGEPTELRLILQNLISNAVKFRDTGRPNQISVTATGLTDGGWRFEVSDTGIGIAPHHLDRIFAIFQRLNPRGAYDGTGIGLAHCSRAVEYHGGQIGVESQLGVGSTFWFTVPEPTS